MTPASDNATRMSVLPRDFLARWHRIVAERNIEALAAVLADDVELGAPPYWGVVHGRDTVSHLLGLILDTVSGFTYRREWCSERDLALEFFGRVGELDLQGIDLITLGSDGQIRRLDVLMRPINAVARLRDVISPKMEDFLLRSAKPA